jgi:hypothetical protein
MRVLAPPLALILNQHWGSTYLNTYVTCTSEHLPQEDVHGRLSMWRASATALPRVALVFSIPFFVRAAYSLGVFFSPVAYMDEADVAAEIGAVIANINTNADFLKQIDRGLVRGFVFQMFLSATVCMKHKAFREELEWRAVLNRTLGTPT